MRNVPSRMMPIEISAGCVADMRSCMSLFHYLVPLFCRKVLASVFIFSPTIFFKGKQEKNSLKDVL